MPDPGHRDTYKPCRGGWPFSQHRKEQDFKPSTKRRLSEHGEERLQSDRKVRNSFLIGEARLLLGQDPLGVFAGESG